MFIPYRLITCQPPFVNIIAITVVASHHHFPRMHNHSTEIVGFVEIFSIVKYQNEEQNNTTQKRSVFFLVIEHS